MGSVVAEIELFPLDIQQTLWEGSRGDEYIYRQLLERYRVAIAIIVLGNIEPGLRVKTPKVTGRLSRGYTWSVRGHTLVIENHTPYASYVRFREVLFEETRTVRGLMEDVAFILITRTFFGVVGEINRERDAARDT